MINIIKKEIKITKDLQSKIMWACIFCKVTPEITQGSLDIVDKTNLAYVEPHKVTIKNTNYLFFNGQNYFYVQDLLHKYPLSKLKEQINKNN